MISSRMIAFQKVMVKSCKVLHPFLVLETEDQILEREQNERDVLEALGECKCDYGMFVEDVTVIVNIKRLKGRLIAHKFNTGWGGGLGEEWKRRVVMVSLQSRNESET